MLALLNFAYYQYGCTFYQYGCAAYYGCATYRLHFVAPPMVVPPKNMVASPNICLRCLILRTTNMVAPSIDMVAPLVMSINMVAPLVMVVPLIVCISWHCLWLRLQKYGCST
jgi:hypothetical protein